ncbi:MAG TPA: hypothetical protein VLC29_10715, partial [Rhizomicrobium sp.]|nr:hypothetical protein [Rhizomicrobium sp.]
EERDPLFRCRHHHRGCFGAGMVGVALGAPQTARSVNEICERDPAREKYFQIFSEGAGRAVQNFKERKVDPGA